ncbi:3',5'-cyclic-nucleotide phosphodiesterase [Ceratobasidium sp. 414]|nr:3',5'-cyclic-nucleotide phosphodiesterase [Ceratobasidium sp. 414]
MASRSVLLLTVNNLSPAHSRRSSVSASVSLPGSPSVGVEPTTRSRGSLPGQRGRGPGGIGGNLGGAEGLLVALSGIGDKGVPDVGVSVRNVVSSSIVEPPARPPTVVFVPLEAHDTLYTPSAICFVSPMGSTWSSPSPASPPSAPRRARPVSSIELSGTASTSAVERVVAHVKRAMNELAGTGIPVIAYTPSQAKLPPQIVDAVKAAGCAEIISAPFTTDSVREVLTKVGPWSVSSAPQALAKPFEPISIPKIVPPTPPSKPSLTLASLPPASTSYQTQPTSASSHMSTLPSLAPLVPPPPHLAARASYSCPRIYAPALPPCSRRRSVDVGGLALALSGVAGHGGGWGGWAGAEEELTLGVPSADGKNRSKASTPTSKRRYDVGGEGEAMYAELLSQMYTQTGAAVDGATSDASPSPPPASPYPTGRPHSVSDPHIPFAYTTGEPSVQAPPPTHTLPDVIKPKPSHPDDVDSVRREELIVLLDRWEFEPHKLSDTDVLACAGLLFEAAFEIKGMEEDVGVRFDQLPPFLRAVRKIYRTQNQYHNFQHALDVFQAVYWFLCRAGVVPPVRILARANGQGRVPTAGTKEQEGSEYGKFVNSPGPEVNEAGAKWRRTRVQGRIAVMRNIDVFALLLAAVGHDVGHPGLSNAFMTNADTPLSRVFDHKSSLEQLHCALLLRLMHKHGMGHLLSSRPGPADHRPGIPKSNGSGLDLGGGLDGTSTNALGLGTGRIGLVSYASSPGLAATYQTHHFARQPRGFRWLLVQTVLATDMSVHFKWLDGFKTWDASGSSKGSEFRQGVVGLTEDEERLMICQALIKCGDISNPTRPHAVSEHWSKVLLEEWACQATFEQELDLPVTVVNVDVSNGAKQQAQGQVNFIDLFTQPLFNATASVIPELHPVTEQCALNRKLWHERMEELSEATPTPASPSRPRATSQTQEAHYRSVFPLSLPPALTQNMGQNANQAQTLGSQQTRPTTATRPSSSGSTSTVGAPSLFSPTGSVSSVSVNGATGPGPVVESNAVRVAYRASVRKKKSFHRVSWPAPAPPPPLPIPSPLRER